MMDGKYMAESEFTLVYPSDLGMDYESVSPLLTAIPHLDSRHLPPICGKNQYKAVHGI
jgi:hypothetical protein